METCLQEERRAYEENWKGKFSQRLQTLTETRGISLALLAETLGCGEARAQTLLAGGDYPTVPELLRLCFLCTMPTRSCSARGTAVCFTSCAASFGKHVSVNYPPARALAVPRPFFCVSSVREISQKARKTSCKKVTRMV